MASPAPPLADTKKPATPPAEAEGKRGGDKGAAGNDGSGADKGSAGKAGQAMDASAQPVGQGKPAAGTGGAQTSASQQRFDRMAVRAKLAVSEPGDAVEREADAVADKVMRMTEPPAGSDKTAAAPANKTRPQLARAVSTAGEQASSEQRQAGGPAQPTGAAAPGIKAGNPVPRTTEGTHGGVATSNPGKGPDIARAAASASAHDDAGRQSVPAGFAEQLGAGEPLDADTRAYFEERLGRDLSQVRVHTDAQAHQAATQIGARAFTYGNHIAFATGQYQPATENGKRLLAHELVHVLQQQHNVARQIMRQPVSSAPAGGGSNDIALKGVAIPAFKLGYYSAAEYQRPANYRRSEKGSKQAKHWKDATAPARQQFPGNFGLKDGSIYVGVPKKTALQGANADMIIGEPKVLAEMVSRPRWKEDGTPTPHDIDHMVELQIGGQDMDRADNLELRDSQANQSSGQSIDASITAKLRLVKDKEDGNPEKIRANPAYTFVFSAFASGGGATNSSVWSQERVNKLDAAEGLNIYDPDASADTGKVKAWPLGVDKSDFFGGPDLLVLYPSRLGGKPQKIQLGPDKKPKGGGQLPKNWIPGFEISSFDLVPGTGDQLGSITVKFAVQRFPAGYALPPIPIRKLSASQTQAGFISVEGVRNKISQLLKAQTPVPQASPVNIAEDGVDVLPGTGLSIHGTITPSVALLGAPIEFQVQGSRFELSKTFSSDELKMPGPFKVTGSSLTVALNSASGFTVTGSVLFEIPRLGAGALVGHGAMDGFSIAGDFIFDRKLFDAKAVLKAAYTKAGEAGKFSGEADLEISNKKIKGIKKATLHAKINDDELTITGSAEADIPGIKQFGLKVEVKDAENFTISGDGQLEQLPGIESGTLSMTLEREGEAWSLSGTGQVTPKLPGSTRATIAGTYKKGVVLIRGKVQFSYANDRVKGDVTVAVTNASSVNEAGEASGEGGKNFKVFGAGEVDAVFIEKKLAGKIKLRLLPDGDVRVGGALTVADFTLFPRVPEGGGEFLDLPISSPRIPLPGAGFSVGKMAVGVTFGASGRLKAHASVGPGRMTGITLSIDEFDPKTTTLDTLEIGGGATFVVDGAAGVAVSATIDVSLSAVVADLTADLTVSGEVGIPEKKPVLSAETRFTYSKAKGLNIGADCNLDVSPSLTFELKGGVSANLNLYVDTVTLWRKDWTLAKANFELPIGFTAKGKLNYNSNTNKLDVDPKNAITVKYPELSAEEFKQILDGSPSKQQLRTTDTTTNEVVDEDQLMCTEPAPEQNFSEMPPAESNASVMPKRDEAAPRDARSAPPVGVSEQDIRALGNGLPLPDEQRSFFEGRLDQPLDAVRIYSGPEADMLATRVSARAFTLGNAIVFAKGEYQPDTTAGQGLLAHELAHVIQQSGGTAPRIMRETQPPAAERPAAPAHADGGTSTAADRDWRPEQVPLLGEQGVEVSRPDGDSRFERTLSADDLNISVPGVTLDAASLSVFFDRNGFGAEGGLYFTLAHLGTGALSVGVDGAGRFCAEGRLDIDTRVFDEADVRVWYRDGAFGGGGLVAITRPGRIRGVNAARIEVSADSQRISASGSLEPALPGVQNAALSADYSADDGLTVGGDLQLAEIVGIREGSVHAELRKRDGDWRVSANGRATPALPGINAEITLVYDDGAFDGRLTTDYAHGIMSGSVTLGLTNRAVNVDGELAGGDAPAAGGDAAPPPAAGDGLSIYGAGTVTARLTDWLQGGVGLQIRPSGDILISGQIGIPEPVTVFDQYPSPERAQRTLFAMPTVSIPLVGLSVGSTVVGVALTINGRVTGHAHIGPGRLTQTELRIEDFNPAQPESLHVTGDAEFNLPAEAGVGAALDAGVSLGAAVINATAGINVSAEAAVHANVTPHVDLDWRPDAGLHLHADLNASLSPRLAFDLNGYAEVTANALVTTFSLWRKEWNLARREVGSSLALGLQVPVDYYSDSRGVVFNPEDVHFEVPALNADTLDQLLNEESGGSEHIERGRPETERVPA